MKKSKGKNIDPKDIIGHSVNYITIIKYLGKPKKWHQYLCKCVCGKTIKCFRHNLIGVRKNQSCGCVYKEFLKTNPPIGSLTHGKSKTSIYSRWSNMISRCYCPKNRKYNSYGARGIVVCKRWHNPGNFIKDMGDPPFDGATLDRINVNGNYSPENLRWADQKTQQNNRRDNIILVINGEKKTLPQWAEIYKIPSQILRQRLFRDDLGIMEALIKPRILSKYRKKFKKVDQQQ